MKPIVIATLRTALALGCIWTLAVLPLHVPWAQAQQTQPAKPRVAVLDFEGVGVNEAEAAAVTDQLRSDLVRLRTFTVLDRAQTESVLQEMALQQSGVTEKAQAAKIGRMLNVQFIITGRITALDGAYQVNAQMVNVETTEIERSDSIVYQGHILGLLQQNIGTMAARLSELPGAREESTLVAGGGGPSRWPLWTGVALVVVAGLLQLDAVSTSADAETLAQQAQAANDPVLYDQADAMFTDAEGSQSTALALGLIGAGLLTYHYLSDGSGGTAGLQGDPAAPPPVRLLASRSGVWASVSVRW